MEIHISSNEGVPIYRQIADQIKFLVASGRLNAGEQLPPVQAMLGAVYRRLGETGEARRYLKQAGEGAHRLQQQDLAGVVAAELAKLDASEGLP